LLKTWQKSCVGIKIFYQPNYIIIVVYLSDDSPDRVIDFDIHLVSSCSFVAQWSEPSSDPVCGTVQYIVTVYSGGIVISNNTTKKTNYTVLGLGNNTLFEINVTAVNDAGSSDPVTREVMTNETGMYARYFDVTVLY